MFEFALRNGADTFRSQSATKLKHLVNMSGLDHLQTAQNWLDDKICFTSFTCSLLLTKLGRLITELLTVIFFIVLFYETIYWSGIYLGLWEYHAKDIFKEIPVHCAHVYIRINMVDRKNVARLRDYYSFKISLLNLWQIKEKNRIGSDLFKFKRFVKYHFEFGPEDFEMNESPEYGSTVLHLKGKILHTFKTSKLFQKYLDKDYTEDNLILFDNKSNEVDKSKDNEYLSKADIETGNVIDCVIIY